MADTLIFDIDDETLKRLEERACTNGRSIELEAREILLAAIAAAEPDDNTGAGEDQNV